MNESNRKMNSTREELLFGLALTKPAAGRAAWLDRECAGEPALRQRLEALLAAHEQTGALLATEPEAARPRSEAPSFAKASEDRSAKVASE